MVMKKFILFIILFVFSTNIYANDLNTFLIGAVIQQTTYEVFHKGMHFDKIEALFMSSLISAVGGGLYMSMDIPNGSNYGNQALKAATPFWLGQGLSIAVTITIWGL